jgi:hypothetical protein
LIRETNLLVGMLPTSAATSMSSFSTFLNKIIHDV